MKILIAFLLWLVLFSFSCHCSGSTNSRTTMIKPLLTAKKAGTLLGVSESFCRKCYGELGGFLIGGKIRFTEESIQHDIQNKIRTVDGTGAGEQQQAVPAPVQNETRGRAKPPIKNPIHENPDSRAHFPIKKNITAYYLAN